MSSRASSSTTIDHSDKQMLKNMIKVILDTYFKGSLRIIDTGGVELESILLSQLYHESSFRTGVKGPSTHSTSVLSGSYNYEQSQPIINKMASGTPEERANVEHGWYAWGFSQSMGWNHVKGASRVGNVCEIERLAKNIPALKGSQALQNILISPGESMQKVVGAPSALSIKDQLADPKQVAYMNNQILSGLVILHGKSQIIHKDPGGGYHYSVGGRQFRFGTGIQAALGAYLGAGNDAVGSTPQAYADNIYSGNAYTIANGSSPLRVASNTGGSAPSTTPTAATTPPNQKPNGCATA